MKIAILGSGSWGAALANLLTENGHEVVCFARNKGKVNKYNETHIHENLPNVKLSEKLKFTNDIGEAVTGSKIVVYAVPSVAFRDMVSKSLKFIKDDMYLVTVTKGMEDNTLFTMSDIIIDELKKSSVASDKIVALSGPTHAEEVAKCFPTTIVSASKNMDAAKFIQDAFMNKYFRVYTNNDIKGVEICAAFKNIIAIASGIANGLGYGDNLKAAIITRGLVEMIRVGEVLNCSKDTFYGLAGIGDMIVTATSIHSRNYRCGKLIGEGKKPDDAIKEIGMVVEGANFLPKAMKLKEKYNLDLPITEGSYNIVIKNADPKKVLESLMMRNKKSE